MKKLFSLTMIATLFASHVLAATPIAELEKVGVKVIHSPNIQTNQDSWIQPEDQYTVTDELDYWLPRLPANQDKKRNNYIVIPKLGVISPVNTASE